LPYKFNKEADTEIRQKKPWREDPNYFDKVKISTLALLKMVTHARSGGDLEIMGMLQGRVEAHTFYVVDVLLYQLKELKLVSMLKLKLMNT